LKTEKLKSKKRMYSEVSVNSPRNQCSPSWRRKGKLQWGGFAEKEQLSLSVDRSLLLSVFNQSINIRLLRNDKMQANNSKQKGNAVGKKKACLDDKPKNCA